jgi:hypothetical protein
VLIVLKKNKKHQRHLAGKTTHSTLLPLKLAAGCIASKTQVQRANTGAATSQKALAGHAMVPIIDVLIFLQNNKKHQRHLKKNNELPRHLPDKTTHSTLLPLKAAVG